MQPIIVLHGQIPFLDEFWNEAVTLLNELMNQIRFAYELVITDVRGSTVFELHVTGQAVRGSELEKKVLAPGYELITARSAAFHELWTKVNSMYENDVYSVSFRPVGNNIYPPGVVVRTYQDTSRSVVAETLMYHAR